MTSIPNEKRALCGICPAACWVVVTYDEAGRIHTVRPDESSAYGAICKLGEHSAEIVYSRDRLRYPMRRKGPRGTYEFERISWDDAYDIIVNRLNGIKAAHGPEAAAVYTGRGSFEQAMCDVFRPRGVAVSSASSMLFPFGSPHTMGAGALCYVAFAMIAPHVTIGGMLINMFSDIENAELIVVWGANPATDSTGLTAPQKYVPSKYFYDARGSRLFELICGLPEYYLTRTELSILKSSASEIMGSFAGGDIVELGAGSNLKIRTLLDRFEGPDLSGARYLPVDVSATALMEAAEELADIYPGLSILCMVADFTKHIGRIPPGESNLILFLGSTIGNLDEREGSVFLNAVSSLMGSADRLVIGIDMVKPRGILEAAYNDAQGITAEFNRNILHVLNRELKARFDPGLFDHAAFYNADEERIEMHLRARRGIRVEIEALDMVIEMQRDETIRTEICRKFTRGGFQRMANRAGLGITRWFPDREEWFCLAELMRVNS